MEENKHRNNHRKQNKKKDETKASNINLYDKERIIFINDEITDILAKEVIEKLLKLDLVNHKDITLYINSPGGSVSAGLAIIDTMNYIKSDVSTICIGRAASMGSILLISGAKGKRYCTENAEVMIHEVSSSALFTKVTEMKERLDHSRSLNDRICKMIVKRTNMSMTQVKKDTVNKDSWYTSHKALKLGFVDRILV